MKFRKEINKALAIPKTVLLRKLLSYLIGKRNKLIDKYANFGSSKPPEFNYLPIYSLPSIDILNIDREFLEHLGKNYIQHKFNVLGSGWVDFNSDRTDASFTVRDSNKPIDWNIDVKSGYKWDSSQKSQKLKYGDVVGADVKVPWELGRLQFLTTLCYNIVLENNKETIEGQNNFLIEYQNVIIDFIESNPVGYGIQWKSTMDVAIRLINLVVSYNMMRDYSEQFSQEFQKLFMRSIEDHINYIASHLEWNDGLRGNHYLYNIAGLIFALTFTGNSESSLFRFATSEFVKELDYQFNTEGSNFEASIPYHFFTAEIIYHTLNIIQFSSNEILTKSTIEKIISIFAFCREVVYPNGTIEQIGDNDSGYVFNFLPDTNHDVTSLNKRHIIKLFDIEKQENDLNKIDLYYESIMPNRVKFDFQSNIITVSDEIISTSFPEFGLYIYKSSDFKMLIRCGSVGQKGKGGHSHNDQLSFTLFYKGQNMIVDTGTANYTGNKVIRNLYRSTSLHNTLQTGSKEQNELWKDSSDDLFWLIDRAKAKAIQADSSTFIGEHKGFGAKYRREVKFDRMEINFTEYINNSQEKCVNLHFDPDCKITLNGDVISVSKENVNIEIYSPDARIQIEKYKYSPAYGVQIDSTKLRIYFETNVYNWSIRLKD